MLDYNKAIELNPDYAAAYYSRGTDESALVDYIRAAADFDRSIELNAR